MIELLFLSVITLIALSIGLYLAKGTILSVTSGYNSIWALLYYKEIILIFVPIFLLSIFPVSDFKSLKMVDQSLVFKISIYVVFSFSVYFIVYVCLLRIFFKNRKLSIAKADLIKSFNKRKMLVFSISALVTGCFLLLFSILFLGYDHALLTSIITGENILHIRLHNAYHSNLPSQISYAITFSYWITAIFSAYLFFLNRKTSSVFVFLIGMLLATAGGAKAPFITYVILFVMAYLYINRPKISLFKLFFMIPLYIVFLLSLIYFIVSLQIPNLDFPRFMSYLIERFGMGQMAGVYETFSIDFNSPQYAWHMVPFASFFVDYPIFSKELMLFTEGREYASTGVKNSLFIAEAYGMGGIYLMLISPIVMAIAYLIKAYILFYSLLAFFGRIVAKVYFIPIFFLSTNLTGDFSSMVFQKGTILLILVLGLVYLVSGFVRVFLSFRVGDGSPEKKIFKEQCNKIEARCIGLSK